MLTVATKRAILFVNRQRERGKTSKVWVWEIRYIEDSAKEQEGKDLDRRNIEHRIAARAAVDKKEEVHQALRFGPVIKA